MVETLALAAKCLLCSETAILTGLFGCRNSATVGGAVLRLALLTLGKRRQHGQPMSADRAI